MRKRRKIPECNKKLYKFTRKKETTLPLSLSLPRWTKEWTHKISQHYQQLEAHLCTCFMMAEEVVAAEEFMKSVRISAVCIRPREYTRYMKAKKKNISPRHIMHTETQKSARYSALDVVVKLSLSDPPFRISTTFFSPRHHRYRLYILCITRLFTISNQQIGFCSSIRCRIYCFCKQEWASLSTLQSATIIKRFISMRDDDDEYL
jgi:hypothetical protein